MKTFSSYLRMKSSGVYIHWERSNRPNRN